LSSKHSQQKILLVNAVLPNNGDAAISLALYNKLKSSGFDVVLSSYYFHKMKAHYPELNMVSEIGSEFVFRKLPFLRRMFKPFLFSFKKSFKSANSVISVPGGYMNSYYDFRQILDLLIYARKKGKTIGVYANSFGPFNENDSAFLENSSSNFSALMARDQKSLEFLDSSKIESSSYFKSNDAAFLLDQKSGKRLDKKVAISVREWKNDSRNMSLFKKLISEMCLFLLKKEYEVEFLSTCQGVNGYTDDSKMAKSIADSLPREHQESVSVNTNYYNLEEFREKLTSYDFVIGTRLHMCLLALKSTVPAFNISYEFKGLEAYKYLGLEQYSADYNSDIAASLAQLSEFVSKKDEIHSGLTRKMEEQKIEAEKGFDQFLKMITSG
jgi:polysaccharide pyruvyl transferase WcaK-like protein